MDTLNNIVVSLPDTISIVTTPKEVILHSCPAATTQLDVALTHEITSTILWAIGIIGVTIILGIAIVALSKHYEQKLRQSYEERKRKDDQTMQEYKNRLDSAWRCLNDFYKKRESGVTDGEQKMANASWDYLVGTFKETQISESNNSK